MTHGACTSARTGLVVGRRDAVHFAQCSACARFAASLDTVDAGLARESADAASAPLAVELRARILAAAAPRPAPRARGRILGLVARAAAVAAVLVAAAGVLPDTLEAAEFDPGRVLAAIGTLPSAAMAGSALPEISLPDLRTVPLPALGAIPGTAAPEGVVPGAGFGLLAAALLGAAALLARRERIG